MQQDQAPSRITFLHQLSPVHRLVIAVTIGVLIFFILPKQFPLLYRLMTAWLGFAITLLFILWRIIVTMPVSLISKRAKEEDGGKVFVFFSILFASFSCLVGVLLLITSANEQNLARTLLLPVAILDIIFSWCLVHTIYIFHYAHLYYGKGHNGSGLQFPENDVADYTDFAYFSFGVGCSFQVSDISTTSKLMRRVVLFHSMISYGLNTFLVSLSINIVSGLV